MKCSALNLVLYRCIVLQCAVKWLLRSTIGASVLAQWLLHMPQFPHRPGRCMLCRSAQGEGVRIKLLTVGWRFHHKKIKNTNGTHTAKSFEHIWNSAICALAERMRYSLNENGSLIYVLITRNCLGMGYYSGMTLLTVLQEKLWLKAESKEFSGHQWKA